MWTWTDCGLACEESVGVAQPGARVGPEQFRWNREPLLNDELLRRDRDEHML